MTGNVRSPARAANIVRDSSGTCFFKSTICPRGTLVVRLRPYEFLERIWVGVSVRKFDRRRLRPEHLDIRCRSGKRSSRSSSSMPGARPSRLLLVYERQERPVHSNGAATPATETFLAICHRYSEATPTPPAATSWPHQVPLAPSAQEPPARRHPQCPAQQLPRLRKSIADSWRPQLRGLPSRTAVALRVASSGGRQEDLSKSASPAVRIVYPLRHREGAPGQLRYSRDSFYRFKEL